MKMVSSEIEKLPLSENTKFVLPVRSVAVPFTPAPPAAGATLTVKVSSAGISSPVICLTM